MAVVDKNIIQLDNCVNHASLVMLQPAVERLR